MILSIFLWSCLFFTPMDVLECTMFRRYFHLLSLAVAVLNYLISLSFLFGISPSVLCLRQLLLPKLWLSTTNGQSWRCFSWELSTPCSGTTNIVSLIRATFVRTAFLRMAIVLIALVRMALVWIGLLWTAIVQAAVVFLCPWHGFVMTLLSFGSVMTILHCRQKHPK